MTERQFEFNLTPIASYPIRTLRWLLEGRLDETWDKYDSAWKMEEERQGRHYQKYRGFVKIRRSGGRVIDFITLISVCAFFAHLRPSPVFHIRKEPKEFYVTLLQN